MQTIAEAAAAWTPPEKPTYDERLYPWGYARSFLVEQADVVPGQITSAVDRQVMSTPNSQGKERKKRHDKQFMVRLYMKEWLESTGEDPWQALTALADRQLEKQGIGAPPERHDKPDGWRFI